MVKERKNKNLNKPLYLSIQDIEQGKQVLTFIDKSIETYRQAITKLKKAKKERKKSLKLAETQHNNRQLVTKGDLSKANRNSSWINIIIFILSVLLTLFSSGLLEIKISTQDAAIPKLQYETIYIDHFSKTSINEAS